MDAEERIARLEKEVKELAELVEQLRAVPAGKARKQARRARKLHARQVFKQDVGRNVNRILGGEAGDTLETRIGGIWLSRITMVLVMTAIVLGARVTFYSEVLGPVEKVGITYGGALLAIAYGLLSRKKNDLFRQTLLGTGLAGVYFASYAGFYVEGMNAFAGLPDWAPLVVLPTCLLLLVSVSHWRRSQTVAGISLFLAYYTVVASCMGGKSAENVYYAFLTCAVLAGVALLFHVLHRWLLFSWAALAATYLTYFFFFLREPAGLAMPGNEYFWLSGGFLSVCYVLFSFACIIDARRTGEYRRTVAPMAGVNSAVFLTITWFAIRQHYPAQEWMFRLVIAGALLGFALFAEATGPRENYLFQIFIAKALIILTLAFQAYFSGDKLMVAFAIEGLGLAFSYKRSGLVVFKVLGLLLLLATFVGCLFHLKTPGITVLGPVVVPSNWFCCAGSGLTFIVVSWFYARFVRRVRAHERVVDGQWFLADTFLDVRSATAALLYAAAASLILLTITIVDLGTAPHLPYVLAGESVAMSAAGLLLFAPQVEIGGVLLLAAAHVCYYLFIALGIPSFERQPRYFLYTVLVALFTFVGAYSWERYLRKTGDRDAWGHKAVAALPYLAATGLLATLLDRTLDGISVPLAQNAVAVLVLLAGALLALPAVKASGLLALGAGAVTFYGGVFRDASYCLEPGFFTRFVLLLASYVVAERILKVLGRRVKRPGRLDDSIRTVLVAVGAAAGVMGLYITASPRYLTLNWIGFAIGAVAIGAVLRESRYRWAAIALFTLSIGRAFQHDFWGLAPLHSFLSFAALAVALLVVAWLYSRYRQKTLEKAAKMREELAKSAQDELRDAADG